VFRNVKLIAGTSEIVRALGISAIAIALAVYAMVLQERSLTVVILGATVLLVAVSGMLQVNRAIRQLHYRQHQTQRSAMRAERHYFKVLRRIVSAIEDREPYTRGRSKRMGFLARRIGEQMGLDRVQSRLLAMAAQVHDIGLLAVPDRILNKASALGNEECRTVQKHPETSYKILEPLTFLSEMLPAVRYHHEKMNGTGYPFQKQQQDIPVMARILAVVEAYDAMTHDRPYRAALPSYETLNELRRCSPAGYDPDCVTALEEVLHARQLRVAHQGQPSAMPSPAQLATG